MRHRRYDCTVWDCCFDILIGREFKSKKAAKVLNKATGDKVPSDLFLPYEEMAGCSFCGGSEHEDGTHGPTLIFICTKDRSLDSVVSDISHECLHAALKTLHRRGVTDHEANGGEPLCYLLDSLVRECMELIQE